MSSGMPMAPSKQEERTPSVKSAKLDLAAVPPQSFRRTDRIERWRFWAPLGLVAVFGIWRGADSWIEDTPGRVWHSPGPLATAHAVYDSQCSVCHAAFSPVSSSNWLALGLGQTHAADGRCMECHEGVNHHGKDKAGQAPSCPACHIEHRGREARLVRTPDGHCTSCHANLHNFSSGGADATLADVSGFTKERHPEFRALIGSGADTRRLKFNHKLHLTPGFRRTENGDPFTLEMVDPRYQTLYGSRGEMKEPVRLECKSCHQLDSRDFPLPADVRGTLPGNAVMPARPPGATMLPIVYEQHCQACHPLSFESSDGMKGALGGAVTPHRQQPDQIRQYLEAYYLQKMERSQPEILNQPFPPLPGKPANPQRQLLQKELTNRVERAEQQLYLSQKICGECHYTTTPIAKIPANHLNELRIAPTNIPEVWFRQADFTHTPHRQVDCLACHEGADTRQETANTSSTARAPRPVLPGIENCLRCHSASSPGGGARQDCVACHKYHNGDHPLSGPGAAARAGPNAGKRSIERFLEPSNP
jgi:hypothetical protein